MVRRKKINPYRVALMIIGSLLILGAVLYAFIKGDWDHMSDTYIGMNEQEIKTMRAHYRRIGQ